MSETKQTALVIMAAGIGSRFGGGIKQLEPVGLHGEIIMDYSIHDAIEAGFNKVVFIIRHDIAEAFREAIGDRIATTCARLGVEIAYAYQEKENLPEGVALPAERTKPWGTGQAVLACKGLLNEPFVVINADDYYGKDSFVYIQDFLVHDHCDCVLFFACFVLKISLSVNVGVSLVICHMILKTATGAEVEGKPVDADSLVSMNMWGLTPAFLDLLDKGFVEFFANTPEDKILKAEYLLPIYIDQLLKRSAVSVKVLKTDDKWFGVTYKEDKDFVVASFRALIEAGVYKEDLFSDL